MLLDDDEFIEARYAAPVQDRIRIRPGQLVALDTSTDPHEIVWRWVRTKVHKIEGDRVLVGDDVASVCSIARVPELDTLIRPGDEVWACGTPDDWEVHGAVVGDQPAHPERLRAHVFPRIEAIYEQLAG